jgi:hypothetical protein
MSRSASNGSGRIRERHPGTSVSGGPDGPTPATSNHFLPRGGAVPAAAEASNLTYEVSPVPTFGCLKPAEFRAEAENAASPLLALLDGQPRPAIYATMANKPSLPGRPPAGKIDPNTDPHRALALLAGSPGGRTASIMMAHGFPLKLLVELIRADLATAHREQMVAGERTMEVILLRITEAGRRALSGAES